MDDLKKYLQQHRDEMDVDSPSKKILELVQLETAPVKKRHVYSMLVRIAAAACIVVVIGFGVNKIFFNKEETGFASNQMNMATTIDSFAKRSLNNTTTTTAQQETLTPEEETILATRKENVDPYQLMHSFSSNYKQLVKLQLKSIRRTPVYGETGDYFDGFKQTLKQVEADEASIKNNIKVHGLNAVLLEQLIQLYQEKLNVLKNLQQEIHKLNDKVKENRQPSDTLSVHYINI